MNSEFKVWAETFYVDEKMYLKVCYADEFKKEFNMAIIIHNLNILKIIEIIQISMESLLLKARPSTMKEICENKIEELKEQLECQTRILNSIMEKK